MMNVNEKQLTLTDIVDVSTLQKIQDAFAKATGMAALTVDLNGPVTQLSNGTNFCMNLTRGCPIGAQRCNQCDLTGGQKATSTGKPAVYYCHAGLMDFAAPILVGNRQIGTMLGGQVLPSAPNPEKFKQFAKEMGINPAEYLEALSHIKQVPKAQIESAAELLYVIANTISDMGYQKAMDADITASLYTVSDSIKEKVKIANQQIEKVTAQNQAFITLFNQLESTVKNSVIQVDKTDEIIKYISDVSMQTRMLGMNASIESARAGEAGKGFGIIAQEVRRLAETSGAQSKNIESVLRDVKTYISEISVQIEQNCNELQRNTAILQEVSQLVGEITNTSRELEKLGLSL